MENSRDDTGLFVGIVGLIAVPLVFLLQANGVVTIRWLPSHLLYIAILGAFVWAYFRWNKPWNWKPFGRYGVLAATVGSLAGISVWGVVSEYQRESPVQLLTLTTPTPPRPPPDWDAISSQRHTASSAKRPASNSPNTSVKGKINQTMSNSPGGIQQYSQGPNSPNIVGNNNHVTVGPEDRDITEVQKAAMKAILSPYSGEAQAGVLIGAAGSDPRETIQYAKKIAAVFHAAGWVALGPRGNGSMPISGFSLTYKYNNSAIANAVKQALSVLRAPNQPEIPITHDDLSQFIEVLVGDK